MSFAGAALQTLAASHMHLGGHEIALFDAGNFVAESRNFAAKLVSGNQRRMNPVLGPAVPLIDMQVRPADGCNFYLDQYIVPAKAWDFDLADLRSWRGFRLDHRQHRFRH